MKADDFKIGKQFKNINTGHVWEVEELISGKVFINLEFGDGSIYLDEDLFVEV